MGEGAAKIICLRASGADTAASAAMFAVEICGWLVARVDVGASRYDQRTSVRFTQEPGATPGVGSGV